MKVILIYLILALALPANAQLRGELLDEHGNAIHAIELPKLPDIDVGVADVIDVLTEFTILEEDNPSFCYQFHGLTDYSNTTISICSRNDVTQRRKTLLHEILHVLYHKIGWDTGGPYEIFINEKANALFMKLYGKQHTVVTPEKQPDSNDTCN